MASMQNVWNKDRGLQAIRRQRSDDQEVRIYSRKGNMMPEEDLK